MESSEKHQLMRLLILLIWIQSIAAFSPRALKQASKATWKKSLNTIDQQMTNMRFDVSVCTLENREEQHSNKKQRGTGYPSGSERYNISTCTWEAEQLNDGEKNIHNRPRK